MERTELDWGRFSKVAGLLGSDSEGERSNALTMACSMLARAGLSWKDVASMAERGAIAAERSPGRSSPRQSSEPSRGEPAWWRRGAGGASSSSGHSGGGSGASASSGSERREEAASSSGHSGGGSGASASSARPSDAIPSAREMLDAVIGEGRMAESVKAVWRDLRDALSVNGGTLPSETRDRLVAAWRALG
jgi:hypothetical protein